MEVKLAELVLIDQGFEALTEAIILWTLLVYLEKSKSGARVSYNSSISISTTCFRGLSFSSW